MADEVDLTKERESDIAVMKNILEDGYYRERVPTKPLKELVFPHLPLFPIREWRGARHASQARGSRRTVFPFHIPTAAGAKIMLEGEWHNDKLKRLIPLAAPAKAKAEKSAAAIVGVSPVNLIPVNADEKTRQRAEKVNQDEYNVYEESTRERDQ
jgi:hypothetical protein